MTTRYFKVLHKAGAYIDDVYYPPADQAGDVHESIVPLKGVKEGKEPQWGVECDAHGNEIGAVPEAAVEKMGDALASQIARNAGMKQLEESATGTVKEVEARKQLILDTLSLLDHADDTHWTADGLPNVKVVCEAAGVELSRKEITEAAADFKRKAE
jgi:hypothetical protein